MVDDKVFLYVPTQDELKKIHHAIGKAIEALSELQTLEEKAFALYIMTDEFEKLSGIKIQSIKEGEL